MTEKFIKCALAAVLIFILSATPALAGPNSFPEVVSWFKEKSYDKVDEFIYDDQTNNILSTAQCDISVHDADPLWEASPYMLSNCSGVVFSFDDLFYNGSVGTELSDEYKNFAPTMAQYPIMRLGFGNNANMLKLVGPLEQRTAGECVLTPEEQEIYMAAEPNHRTLSPERISKTGLMELIAASEAMNPDIQFTLILSFVYATPEDNANLMRFLMDDPKESEWGQMRAQYGHPEPVKVHSLEIGNEVYTRKSYGEEEDKRQVDFYVKMFKAHADAIAKYYPNIGCSICLMCMDGEAHEVWNEPIIRELGPYVMEKYDENNRWVSLHHYYSGYEMAYTRNRIQVQIDSLNKILGEGHNIRGLFSEHSKWASDWVAPTTLESGLATCQFLNRMYQWDYLTSYAAHYFDWNHPALWNTFRRSPKDGALVRSGPDYMYKIYIDNLGDRVFRSDVETLDDSEIGDINSTRQLYSVCAMAKGDKELKLIMANRAPNTDIDLTFNFDSGNSYTLVKEEQLTAPNIYSFPYSAETQDIFTHTVTDKNESGFTTYKMPAKSMIVLTLKSGKNIAKLGDASADTGDDAKYEGEVKFADVANHWAANEINLLAADGKVSGREEGVFAPDEAVTRAEFSALLANVLSTGEEGAEIAFFDVGEGDWYRKAVNFAASSGYMRGYGDGSFLPNKNITLSEAAACIARAMSDSASAQSVNADEVLSGVSFSSQLDGWEKDCFAQLISNHMFSKFYEGRIVEKDRPLTRAEAAVLIYRLKSFKGV